MDEDFEQANLNVKIFAASFTLGGLAILVVGFVLAVHRQRQSFWSYGVRLPSRPNRPCWYLIALSVGCRPWAGYEGNIFVQLVGTQGESETFLINGEPFPRLYEASSHLYVYASPQTLGEITYINIVCGANHRRKKWFLSSVHVIGISQLDRGKQWYFPYHSWIEVFLDPVRVTLCGVDIHHDVNKRLLLGWLGRGVSDFHLCLSILGPLKYTQFYRSQRFLCCGTFFTALTAVCMYLSKWIPNLGVFILGIYTSVFTALPIYFCEWLLRMTKRSSAVLKEDLYWYTDYATSPIAYNVESQGRIEDLESSLVICPRDHRDQYQILQEFRGYDGILINDDVFWTWLNDAGEKSTGSYVTTDNRLSTHSLHPPSMAEKIKRNLKSTLANLNPIDYISNIFTSSKPSTETIEKPEDFTAATSTSASSRRTLTSQRRDLSSYYDTNTSPSNTTTSFDQYMGKQPQQNGSSWIDLRKNNLEVKPMAMWKVDSKYSLANEDLEKENLQKFTLLESMPVEQFDKLRPGQQSLLYLNNTGTEKDQFTEKSKDHVYRKLVKQVLKIKLPQEAQHLSFEEGQLVSMLYFDLNTKNHQWLKPEVPMQMFTVNTNIQLASDWIKIEVSSQEDDNHNWNALDLKGRETEKLGQRTLVIDDMQHWYTEPFQRVRVFSMLMFPEYVSKLAKSYEEMAQCAQLKSYVSDMFALFGNSKKSSSIFCDICVELAPHPAGRKALCAIFCGARQSQAWSELICHLAQRLQFQGDNIKRIRRKYELDAECHSNLKLGDERKEKACFEEYSNKYKNILTSKQVIEIQVRLHIHGRQQSDALHEIPETNRGKDDVGGCLYYEMDRMHIWSKKLDDLHICCSCWTLENLYREELTCLSRFFRTMLMDDNGCVLFIELLLQVSLSVPGSESIAGILQSVALLCDGVERMADLHMALGESGPMGRKLLLQLYSVIKQQSPCGEQIMVKVADCLGDVPTGKLLITDLQIDGKKAIRVALQIKSEIRNDLHPLVKSTSQCISHVIRRMNELACCMLKLTNHAKAVLEREDGDRQELYCRYFDGKTGLNQSNLPWNFRFTKFLNGVDDLNCRKTDLGNSVSSRSSCKTQQAKFFSNIQSTDPAKSFVEENEICERGGEENESRNATNCGTDRSLLSVVAANMSKFNDFFLQSKNYEDFYLNFNYRPPCCGCDLSCSKCGETLPKDDSRKHSNESAVKQAAAKWGREVVVKKESSQACQSKVSKCSCADNNGGCIICSVANEIAEAKNSSDAENIISDFMTKCPSTSRKLFQECSNPITVTENAKDALVKYSGKLFSFNNNQSENCPEIATLYHKPSMKSLSPANCSSVESQNAEHSVSSANAGGNFPVSYFSMGISKPQSTHQGDLANNSTPKSSAPSIPFPSSCTKRPSSAQQPLPKDANPTTRKADLVSLWKHIQSKSSEKVEKNKNPHSKDQSTISRPITAKDIRENEHALLNESSNNLLLPKSQIPNTKSSIANPAEKERKIYPSMGEPARNAPQEYWEGSENRSEFSHPEFEYKDELEYCEQCGGKAEVKKRKELTYAYRYLINREKGRRQGSSSSASCNDDASWGEHNYDNCKPKLELFDDKPGIHKYHHLRRNNNYSYRNSYNKITEHISSFLQRWIPLEESIFPKFNNDDQSDDDEFFVTSNTRQCRHHSCQTIIPDVTARSSREREVAYMDEFDTSDEKIDSRKRDQKEFGDTHLENVDWDHKFRTDKHENHPTNSYLLPLKAVRSYQKAVKKFGKKQYKVTCPSVVTDSGVSMDNNSMNLGDSDDEESEVNYPRKKTLMKLMGLSQGIDEVSYPPSTCYSYMSMGSYQSGPCFQSKRPKGVSILQLLQGFGCESLLEDSKPRKDACGGLDLDWWRQHDEALQFVQQCVDSCVRFSVLIAQNEKDLLTEHEKTCKTCTPRNQCCCDEGCLRNRSNVSEKMGGAIVGLRYSEMLPSIWRAEIRGMEETNDGKNSNQIPRFYHKLVEAAVKSTRILLLAPDMHGSKNQQTTSNSKTASEASSIGSSAARSKVDKKDTAFHLEKLAQFREMILSLNKLRKKVSKMNKLHLISDYDVKLAMQVRMTKTTLKDSIRACSVFEKLNKVHFQEDLDATKNMFVNSLTDYVKDKMCGSVQDCGDALNYPWQFSMEEQRRTGGFIASIVEFLKRVTNSGNLDEATVDDAMYAIIESYLGEIIFKATTQTCIQHAVEQATVVKQYLANLELIARLCLAKLKGFSSTVEHAVQNTQNIVKKCLQTVEKGELKNEFTEEWWKDTEHKEQNATRHNQGDVSQSTMDDVFIGFERLRHHIRCDLCLANLEVMSMEQIADQHASDFFKGAECQKSRKNWFDTYDTWTDSKITLEKEKSSDKKEARTENEESSKDPKVFVFPKPQRGSKPPIASRDKNNVSETDFSRIKSKSLEVLEEPRTTVRNKVENIQSAPAIITENYRDNKLPHNLNLNLTANKCSERQHKICKIKENKSASTEKRSYKQNKNEELPELQSATEENSKKQRTTTFQLRSKDKEDLAKVSEESIAETTLIRDEKTHEVVDTITKNMKSADESLNAENRCVSPPLRKSHVMSRKADIVETARRAMVSVDKLTNVSEDTIEETVLIRDQKTHEIVDVVSRKSRISGSSPYPSGRVLGTRSEDNDSSVTFSDKLDCDSLILSVACSSDGTDYVTCSSLNGSTSDLGEAISDTASNKTSYGYGGGTTKGESQFPKNAIRRGEEPFVPDKKQKKSSNISCKETHSPVSYSSRLKPAVWGNTKFENSPEANWCESSTINNLNSDHKGNKLAKTRLHKLSTKSSKRRVKNELTPSGWFWDCDGEDGSESTPTKPESSPTEPERTPAESKVIPKDFEPISEKVEKPQYLEEQYLESKPQPIELLNFNNNITSLVQLQCGQIFPFWISIAVQCLLCAMAAASTYFACYMAYVEGFRDESLFWSVPIAIFSFVLVLEPLKCLGIAWVLFLLRRIPAFYNCPVFIKSNSTLVLRGSLMKPKTSIGLPKKQAKFSLEAEDYQDALYRKYVENRPRPGLTRNRRRVLPALAESDIYLRLHEVQSFAAVQQANGKLKVSYKMV